MALTRIESRDPVDAGPVVRRVLLLAEVHRPALRTPLPKRQRDGLSLPVLTLPVSRRYSPLR